MADKEEHEQSTEEQEQRKEFLDRCFEFFKHITTLSTATGLLLLTISREQQFQVSLLALALSLLAACVVLSVSGMLIVAALAGAVISDPSAGSEYQAVIHRRHRRTDRAVFYLTVFAGTIFLGAVMTVGLSLLNVSIPILVWIVGWFFTILVLVDLSRFVIALYLRRRAERRLRSASPPKD